MMTNPLKKISGELQELAEHLSSALKVLNDAFERDVKQNNYDVEKVMCNNSYISIAALEYVEAVEEINGALNILMANNLDV